MNNSQNVLKTSTVNITNKKHTLNDHHQMGRKNQGKHNNTKKTKNKSQMAQQPDLSEQMFELMQEQVRSRLQFCEPGQELDILNSSLKPDTQLLWLKYMEVKSDLLLALQRFYPFVRLEVFGSTVMGIAFKDSDFDFFIELSHEPLNAKPAAIIGKTMNILRQSGNFTNFLPISHARVPILKCYHLRTSMAVDINFSDPYGIANSSIVARLLTYDSRIYVLAVILKYWAKIHDCAGKNRISNYALIWMLLFYLQQHPEPILPPINEFQKRINPNFVNCYNFAFNDRLTNQTKNRNRCSELMLGFFEFYRNFDFQSYVICPLYGKAYRKADVLENKLPEFQRYREILNFNPKLSPMQFNKCICIQDPFEITHAIPGVIATSEFQKILWKFEYAAEIIASELQSEGESTKLLMSIFDAEKFKQNLQQKLSKRAGETHSKLQTQNATITILHIHPNDYHISKVIEILTKNLKDSNAVKIDSQKIHRFWAEFMIECIISIIRDIFMLEMENLESSDVEMDLNETFSKEFKVKGSRDVFLGRKQTKKISVFTLNSEKLETQKRFKNAEKIQLKATTKIKADDKNFDKVTIEFHDLIKTKKNNSFRTFSTYFDQNLNNLLKIYLVHRSGSV